MQRTDELLQAARELEGLWRGFQHAVKVLDAANELEDTVAKLQGEAAQLETRIEGRKVELEGLDKGVLEKKKELEKLIQGIGKAKGEIEEMRKALFSEREDRPDGKQRA